MKEFKVIVFGNEKDAREELFYSDYATAFEAVRYFRSRGRVAMLFRKDGDDYTAAV